MLQSTYLTIELLFQCLYSSWTLLELVKGPLAILVSVRYHFSLLCAQASLDLEHLLQCAVVVFTNKVTIASFNFMNQCLGLLPDSHSQVMLLLLELIVDISNVLEGTFVAGLDLLLREPLMLFILLL